jgi:hypothetical protein
VRTRANLTLIVGTNGQSFDEIIKDINAFFAVNNELVILNCSHDLNTDVGRSYRTFVQEEWDRFMEQLMGLDNLFIASNPASVDLTTLPLNTFIGGNRAAVVVIAEPSDPSITLGTYVNRGIYTYSQFNAYNMFSDTDDVNDMVADQIRKMHNVRTSPDAQLFLLSWTLAPGAASSVLDLAAQALPKIYTDVVPCCNNKTYPNILLVDGLDSNNISALAMAINAIASG